MKAKVKYKDVLDLSAIVSLGVKKVNEELKRYVCPESDIPLFGVEQSKAHNEVWRLVAKNEQAMLLQVDKYSMSPGAYGIEQYVHEESNLMISYVLDGISCIFGYRECHDSVIARPAMLEPYPLMHCHEATFRQEDGNIIVNEDQFELVDVTYYDIQGLDVYVFTLKSKITGVSFGTDYLAWHAGRYFFLAENDPAFLHVKARERLQKQLEM